MFHAFEGEDVAAAEDGHLVEAVVVENLVDVQISSGNEPCQAPRKPVPVRKSGTGRLLPRDSTKVPCEPACQRKVAYGFGAIGSGLKAEGLMAELAKRGAKPAAAPSKTQRPPVLGPPAESRAL
jgi:hypothetical protein